MNEEDFADYYYMVQQAAAARDGRMIASDGQAQARALLANLIESARSSVRILTGSFDHNVYSDGAVLERITEFLANANRKMEVIVERPGAVLGTESESLLRELSKHSNFDVYTLCPDAARYLSFHFVAIDSDCFRFEQDRVGLAAFGAFGEQKFTPRLVELFEKLKAKAGTERWLRVEPPAAAVA